LAGGRVPRGAPKKVRRAAQRLESGRITYNDLKEGLRASGCKVERTAKGEIWTSVDGQRRLIIPMTLIKGSKRHISDRRIIDDARRILL
jgi:hypothetical protein